jgi:hypothetical protein
VRPDALQQALDDIHGRFAAELDDVLNLHLPDATDHRFRRFFDGLSEGGWFDRGVPPWAMSFYHVQEALMSAYYHRRNLEQLERKAIAILRRALGDEEFEVPKSRMSIGARTLSAEYHAYLLAVRRIFDYAARGTAIRLAGEPAKLGSIREVLRKRCSQATVDRVDALVGRTFGELRDVFNRRNFLSHEEPIPVGQFEIVLAPGRTCRIAFVQTEEQIDESEDVELDQPSLPSALDQQLRLVEDLLFEFAAVVAGTL